jgi:ABC-type sulfate transport system permease subunit
MKNTFKIIGAILGVAIVLLSIPIFIVFANYLVEGFDSYLETDPLGFNKVSYAQLEWDLRVCNNYHRGISNTN